MRNTDAIIVGAGPAGLACAVTLRAAGFKVTVFEKADGVGAVWRRHYDRLHLHTDRNRSGLPGMAMPQTYPTYPSREQMVEYFESYAVRFDISPVFDTTVSRIRRNGSQWCADANGGTTSAPVVVVATGIADAPYRPSWPGSELYRGAVVHSSEYRNPAPYEGKRVLVVGFGNSGGEIALDLANARVNVALAVRSPVQILPRELLGLLGFPILAWAILYRRLPARMVDLINAPILRLAVGRIESLGLRRGQGTAPNGRRGRACVVDRRRYAGQDQGRLDPDTRRYRSLTFDAVIFDDASSEKFDAIVLATGFRPDLRQLMPDVEGVFDGHGMPLVTGEATGAPGLYFCGQITSPTGQLREIGLEAQRIAEGAMRYAASR